MLNICLVKYGTHVQGFEINKLIQEFLTPIYEQLDTDFKVHIATDEPFEFFVEDERATDLINFIQLSKQELKDHEHWSKIFFFNPQYINAKENDTTVIMDIDMQWQKDPTPVLTYPVELGQMVSMDRWWRDNDMPLSGNLYRFNSHDFKFIYDNYMEDFKKHRKYYYDKGIVAYPNEGEQYFVYDQIKSKTPWFNLKLQPAEWCMKMHVEDKERQKLYESRFKKVTGKDYHDHIFEATWTYKANK